MEKSKRLLNCMDMCTEGVLDQDLAEYQHSLTPAPGPGEEESWKKVVYFWAKPQYEAALQVLLGGRRSKTIGTVLGPITMAVKADGKQVSASDVASLSDSLAGLVRN
jgi:hypothetical protein